MTGVALPFDAMAADYDRAFTESAVGRCMRAAVWRRFDAAFAPGDRVLELNCGTGEDAVHLARRGVRVVATDIAPGMVAATRHKVARAGVEALVSVAELAIEDLPQLRAGGFDGVLSNFGGLNCVDDLPAAAEAIAALVRPGGRAVLCLMGPAVPWEWGWYLVRGQPRRAFRRLARDGAAWRGLTIRYPSIGETRRAFAPHFVAQRVAAIGALVPPTYAGDWAARRPRLLAMLDRLERRIETIPPMPWLADHYLIEFVRR